MAVTKDSSYTGFTIQRALVERRWTGPTTGDRIDTYKLTRTRTGQRLNKWREVIAAGGNATTPLQATWDSMETSPPVKSCVLELRTFDKTASATHTVKGNVGLHGERGLVLPVEPLADVSFEDNNARAKFYKKLHGMQTHFQGEIFLGELRETLHMLRRPASALWDRNLGYLAALRKAKRSDPKNWLKTLSGLWLENAFGWQPLLNDCKDAYKAYERLVQPDKEETVAVSGSFRRWFDRSSTSLLTGFRPGDLVLMGSNSCQYWYNTSSILTQQNTVRYKGAVKTQTRATKWDNLDLFGFNAKEFIPTAWELLPWSFLIDYFTNVGDMLEASIVNTANVSYVNKTVITETFWRGGVASTDTKPPGYSSANWYVLSSNKSSWNWSIRRRKISRQPDVGISLPTFQLSFDLNDGQLGNIAALLGQANSLHKQSRRLRL
jgi:hypothetical protein